MLLARSEYFLLKRERLYLNNGDILFKRAAVLFKKGQLLSFIRAAHSFRSPVRFALLTGVLPFARFNALFHCCQEAFSIGQKIVAALCVLR
jgi:hypothetical protein